MGIDLFLESIKSPKTKEGYADALRRFCSGTGIKEAKLGKTPAKKIQTKLIEFVVKLKKEGKSYSSQNVAISAVRKYCEAYDIEVNFTKVYRYIGEQTTNHDDKPYLKEQIAKMLDAADPRAKALILLLASTGIRAGAVPDMQIKDLVKIEGKGLYKVVVYASSPKDRYYTFTTPEACQAIDAYLALRKVAGETIKPNAPLFRQTFPKADAEKPKPLVFDSISAITQRTLVKAGLRVTNGDPKIRHATATNHGFRKFFNTMLVRAGVKPVVVEILTGHSIGLQDNYLRLEETDVLNEYLKAVDLLTVSNEKALQIQVEQLKEDVEGIKFMKQKYHEIKLDNEKTNQTLELITDALRDAGVLTEKGLDVELLAKLAADKRKEQARDGPSKYP